MNIREIYNRGNSYFDIYYLYDDDSKHYVGILEDHCRKVKSRYFVGWHFKNNMFVPGSYQPGETGTFNSKDDAIAFVLKGGS